MWRQGEENAAKDGLGSGLGRGEASDTHAKAEPYTGSPGHGQGLGLGTEVSEYRAASVLCIQGDGSIDQRSYNCESCNISVRS